MLTVTHNVNVIKDSSGTVYMDVKNSLQTKEKHTRVLLPDTFGRSTMVTDKNGDMYLITKISEIL